MHVRKSHCRSYDSHKCDVRAQVALQLFWLLSFFPEPLSMTAQSLIARDTTDRPQVVKTAWLLVRMAGFLSVALAGLIAMSFLFGAYLFSPDQDIIDGVHDLVVPVRHPSTLACKCGLKTAKKSLDPGWCRGNKCSACVQGMTGIVVCTYVMQCDGIFIGSLDFAHLPRTNLVACGVCSGMLWLGVRRGYGLNWVWWCMVTFFIVRLLQHMLHAAWHWEHSAFGHYRARGQLMPAPDADKIDAGRV